MGFDVVGMNARSEKGEYFRNNIWWWPRLWDFSCYVARLSDETHRAGCFNSGRSIIGEEHARLKQALKSALENKEQYSEWIKKSEDAYKGTECGGLAFQYPFDWKNVEEFYQFVSDNDGFEIW